MADAVGRFHWLVIDTVDPDAIAPFWCELLGVEQRGWFADDYLMLTADDHTPPVAFQRVPEAKAFKNRLHVDLQVDDLDEAEKKVVDAGGKSARRRAIRTGRRNSSQVEVLSGLAAGERVLVSTYAAYANAPRLQ